MSGIRLGVSLLTVRPGQIGGAETYVRALLNELSGRDEIDRLTILANSEVESEYGEMAGGRVTLTRIDGMEPGGSSAGRALRLARGMAFPRRLIATPSRDFHLLHFPVAVGIPEPRIPWAVTLHDVAHHAVPEHFSRAERTYRAVAYDRSARRANLVFTDSEHARGQIVQFLGIDPQKVVAIHLGIDLERYQPGPVATDADTLHPFDLPERFVYYPANMWPHKNHLTLVAAMEHVADRNLHLVLTGQTYGRDEELRAAVRRAGVLGRVHHLGYVPGRAVPALYRRCVAMVFPSLFEGFGSPPLEAMACGAPVAATSAGSLPEVLGDAAVQFDPQDPRDIAVSIERLASDEELRSAMSERGRAQARTFTWRKSADAHIERYLRLVTQEAPTSDA